MRLDPATTQHTLDAGWLAGYEEGRREGFRSGYHAAVTDAHELLDRHPPHPLTRPRPTGPPHRDDPRRGRPDLIQAARRSWGLTPSGPTPPAE